MSTRLLPTGEREWHVIDEQGTVLVKLSGPSTVDAVQGPALASLVADHGYPNGRWTPDGDGFVFTPKMA